MIGPGMLPDDENVVVDVILSLHSKEILLRKKSSRTTE